MTKAKSQPLEGTVGLTRSVGDWEACESHQRGQRDFHFWLSNQKKPAVSPSNFMLSCLVVHP